MAALTEVCQVVVVAVSLALEGYRLIGRVPSALLHKTEEPFKKVDDVEWNPQQLALLGGMDAFMVHHITVYP